MISSLSSVLSLESASVTSQEGVSSSLTSVFSQQASSILSQETSLKPSPSIFSAPQGTESYIIEGSSSFILSASNVLSRESRFLESITQTEVSSPMTQVSSSSLQSLSSAFDPSLSPHLSGISASNTRTLSHGSQSLASTTSTGVHTSIQTEYSNLLMTQTPAAILSNIKSVESSLASESSALKSSAASLSSAESMEASISSQRQSMALQSPASLSKTQSLESGVSSQLPTASEVSSTFERVTITTLVTSNINGSPVIKPTIITSQLTEGGRHPNMSQKPSSSLASFESRTASQNTVQTGMASGSVTLSGLPSTSIISTSISRNSGGEYEASEILSQTSSLMSGALNVPSSKPFENSLSQLASSLTHGATLPSIAASSDNLGTSTVSSNRSPTLSHSGISTTSASLGSKCACCLSSSSQTFQCFVRSSASPFIGKQYYLEPFIQSKCCFITSQIFRFIPTIFSEQWPRNSAN